MKQNIQIVFVGVNVYVGEVVKHNNYLQIKNAIQININPMNNQVSVTPPLFGKVGNIEIHEPTNIVIYDADDKVVEQYEKALSAFKSGILPVNQLPPNITHPSQK